MARKSRQNVTEAASLAENSSDNSSDLVEGMSRPAAHRIVAPRESVALKGLRASGRPGRRHELDAEYFARIDAMTFALAHDDGQSARNYDEADVILVGVSRTSKTPTCIYLANRGIKAANVPVVLGCPLPPELLSARRTLVVGLTKDPTQLVHIRRNRLRLLSQDDKTDYVDPDSVREELAQARRLCAEHSWPVLDVTRRSIEETAAAIIQMLGEHRSTPVPA